MDIAINHIYTDTLSVLCAQKFKDQNHRDELFYNESESRKLVRPGFVMHGLSCCQNQHCSVLPDYWLTGTVNFHEESGGGERWKNSSDFFSSFHVKVFSDVAEKIF